MVSTRKSSETGLLAATPGDSRVKNTTSDRQIRFNLIF